MFEKLHHVILIHDGRCLLRSNVDQIRDFFDERGFPVPTEESPADWMLTVSQKYDIKTLEEHGFFRDYYVVVDEGGTSKMDAVETELERSISPKAELLPKKDCGAAQIWTETRLLLRREWNRAIRDKVSTLSRFSVALTGGVLLGIVFFGVAADQAIESSTDFLSHVGALFFFLFGGFMTAPDLSLEFIDHRPIFEREFRTGHYHLVSHAIVNIIMEASFVLIMSLLYFPVAFLAIGFQGRFWYMFLIFFTNAFSFVTLGILIASAFRVPKLARDLLMIMTLPAGLFCGFYVAVSELPSWLQWLSWITPLLYTLRLFLMEEFQFCAVPVGRDADLLACARGLEDFFNTDTRFTNKDDAVATLAQTGIYLGPTGIAEYARLISASSEPNISLFYDACTVSDNLELLVHSVSDSYCDVSTATILAGYISPLMALYPDQGTESILGHRLKFAPPDEGTPALIDEDHAYWTNPREESFGPFDVDKISRNVCDTLQNVCSEEYFHFDNSTQCVDAMLSLPEGEWTTSSGKHVYTGNSSICRGIHSFMARENPEANCAHLSWPSQADPKGNFKCDDKIFNNATFEFSEEELEMFRQVSYNYGIRNVTQSRNVDPGDLGDCVADVGQVKLLVLNALDKKDEFENLHVVCYSHLQSNDATPNMRTTYWIALLALIVAQRLLAGVLFRRNSLTRN
jgi:ABC-type multidrug transport system permease subunit